LSTLRQSEVLGLNLFRRLLGLKLALRMSRLAWLMSEVPLKGRVSQKAFHSSQVERSLVESRISLTACIRSEPGAQSRAISADQIIPMTSLGGRGGAMGVAYDSLR
jgi:hypothetical protein